MKELHTGRLYWPTTRAKANSFTALEEHTAAKIAVVGGGMSGVMCAHTFVTAGLDTLLIERGDIAGGSTSANTGLLQFCNDVMLVDLIGQIGRDAAERFYRRCKEAVDQLALVASTLPEDVGFRRRSSLYYASTEQDLPKLKKEFEALLACGLDVEYWSPDDIAAHFPFRKPGAIVTHGDAEVNPYQFVSGLADAAIRAGLRAYENTDVTAHEKRADGTHRLVTSNGFQIDADYVVYAVGYEPEELRGKLVKASLNRSYALVTGVQPSLGQWHQNFLLWETARPYLYLRTTIDGRVVVGGLDEEIEQPIHSEKKLARKTGQLMEKLHALFPDLTAEAEYEWNATFGESQDNLPFIGEDPLTPGVFYSLGYGGNGTVYSTIGAHIIRDMIRDKSPHPLSFIGIRGS
ncbi:NAD(P)/FAD-dependent oxidoreductase [Paenibacillus sp. GCM10027627]|uniref:NAD(P)/FAD-dependent oxidoreductase n=1 Tax=unclassified Paenibacillus TaxID=185978 RepID=UPI003632BDED